MNRIEFIAKLKELLNDIPDNEREEAISFYNDYFDEAGLENENSVIDDLESPEKVAATIKAGLSDKPDENGEYSERGYQNRKFVDRKELSRRTETRNNSGTAVRRETSAGKIILIIILCLFASPVLLPFAFAVLGIAFAIVVAAISLVFALCCVGVGVLAVGIVLVGVGFAKLIVAPFAALCLLGVGLMLSGLSLIGLLLLVMAAAVIIPALVRGIVRLFQKPFRKKEVA